jgi:hypothetical protein
MTTIKRLPPLAPESLNPLCAMCGQPTVLVDRFHCFTCHASWDPGNYWNVDGEWDEPGLPQCNAKIMPWKGSVHYPSLATVVEHCLLTEGHDPARHRSSDHDWTDQDADGYQLPSALNQSLAEDIVATARTATRALLDIPPS